MRKAKVWLVVFFSVVLGLILTKNIIFRAMADYLILNEQLEKSDVIIVLGGETQGERTERAVELYQNGLAPRLLFSDGTSLSWRTKAVDEMTALATKLGVPERDIYNEESSRSTYENALYTKEVLQKNHWKSAVVVTTDWHSKRSQYIFEQLYQDTGIHLTYAGAKDKRFDHLQNWWQDGEKQEVVLSEWAKLIVYWLKY
ncbi:YdcF family protein [Ammoniphilus sp. 3BR4]|uniref:YdcF family protein n=1 Tax=Ammoniphilus sp. 3BR4 TaxID=3158265 RepID=UPI0034655FCB